jgi:hypothetical protein
MPLHFQSKLVPVLLVIERLICFAELLRYLETVPRFTNSLSSCTLFFSPDYNALIGIDMLFSLDAILEL